MSTRAVFTFIEDGRSGDAFHIYKHCDGYPSHAAKCIRAAVPLAWPLPRFEACEFAAAFVAANKEAGGGNIYLTTSWEDHGDLEYRYEISLDHLSQRLHVKVYRISAHASAHFSTIFVGDLETLESTYKGQPS